MIEPELHHRSQLLAAGYSAVELRQQLRGGDLTPLRRGTYLAGPPPNSDVEWHALAALAVVDWLGDGAVFSHVTAAVLHGLPIWNIALDRVHATRPRHRGGRRSRRVHMHSSPLSGAEIDTARGLPVTSVERTVLDLARTEGFAAALAVADAALHGDPDADPPRVPLHPDQLAAALTRATRWPGVPAARRLVAFADGRSESVGESRSRIALHRAGLPAPVLQWRVADDSGRQIGFADFGWPAQRTLGEFDGKVKYGRLLRPGQDPGEVVFAEKQREDRIRDCGFEVVRWTWSDLTSFNPTAARLRAAFTRAATRGRPS